MLKVLMQGLLGGILIAILFYGIAYAAFQLGYYTEAKHQENLLKTRPKMKLESCYP